MQSCSVLGCSNSNPLTADSSVHYYYFPRHPVYLQQWIQACVWQASEINLSTAQICSIHFDNDSYTQQMDVIDGVQVYTQFLKFNAIPTLYLPSTQSQIVTQQTENTKNSKNSEIVRLVRLTVPEPVLNDKEYIELHIEELIKTEDIENSAEIDILPVNNQVEPVENSENVTGVKAVFQINQLQKESKAFKLQIEHLQKSVEDLQIQEENTRKEFVEKDNQLEILKNKYFKVKHSSMSRAKQLKLLGKVFSQTQIKMLIGKKKSNWTKDDLAMGYTIRYLSNKRCYEYLMKNLNIPLPAISSIKRWLTTKGSRQLEAPKKTEEDSQ